MIKIFVETADIRIIDNVSDAYQGEVYGTLIAYKNDVVAGTVDYTINDNLNIFYIRMINTDPNYRRQGIATALCKYIKDNYSNYVTDWGYTTAEGEILRKKLTKDVPNEEYSKLKNKISTIQKRLDEIEEIVNTEDDEEFEKLKQFGLIDKYGSEWEHLYDEQRIYIDEINDLEPYVTIWK